MATSISRHFKRMELGCRNITTAAPHPRALIRHSLCQTQWLPLLSASLAHTQRTFTGSRRLRFMPMTGINLSLRRRVGQQLRRIVLPEEATWSASRPRTKTMLYSSFVQENPIVGSAAKSQPTLALLMGLGNGATAQVRPTQISNRMEDKEWDFQIKDVHFSGHPMGNGSLIPLNLSTHMCVSGQPPQPTGETWASRAPLSAKNMQLHVLRMCRRIDQFKWILPRNLSRHLVFNVRRGHSGAIRIGTRRLSPSLTISATLEGFTTMASTAQELQYMIRDCVSVHEGMRNSPHECPWYLIAPPSERMWRMVSGVLET